MLHYVTYVTSKITLNFPDYVSNMIYSHFFLSLAQVSELLITQLHDFSIYVINALSFCRCICYLVFHMLFPSICMIVIEYTYIKSVSEYSNSIRLLFKRIVITYYDVLHYFAAQVIYVTLQIPLNIQEMGLQHDLLVLICMLT